MMKHSSFEFWLNIFSPLRNTFCGVSKISLFKLCGICEEERGRKILSRLAYEENMEKMKICDTHNDFLTELPLDEIVPYVERCKGDGVQKICASFWSSKKKEEEIERELSQRAECLQGAGDVALLHLEDLWWVKDEKRLEFLLGLKPFSCSLTWNDENLLAGGSKNEAGLSDWGKHCLEKILEAGIVVDVAHLNRKSFWQVAKILKSNIFCSHTGFCGVKRHKRNLTDEQVDFIVRSGGFVGLFFFDDCIKQNGTRSFGVEMIVQNFRYFTSRWGFDNIGFGTDFFGIEKCPLGLEDYCDFGRFAEAMTLTGFSERQIEKIFWRNFEDFLTRVHNF